MGSVFLKDIFVLRYRHHPPNCLRLFGHSAGMALKGLKKGITDSNKFCIWKRIDCLLWMMSHLMLALSPVICIFWFFLFWCSNWFFHKERPAVTSFLNTTTRCRNIPHRKNRCKNLNFRKKHHTTCSLSILYVNPPDSCET